jgi:hypothetical protein
LQEIATVRLIAAPAVCFKCFFALESAVVIIMVLGEEFLKNILRAPPKDPSNWVNKPHPFQTDFSYYLRKRFIKNHHALVLGYAFSLWCFGKVDGLMESAKTKKYEDAIMAGKVPFGHHH